MPIEVLKDALFSIGGVDLSGHVESITVNYLAEEKDAPVMGDDGMRRLSGLFDWSMAVSFRQDFDAAEVESTLFPLVGTEFAVKARKSKTDAIGATNPEYQGNGRFSGDVPVIAGTVGEVHNVSVTIVGSDGVKLIRAVV